MNFEFGIFRQKKNKLLFRILSLIFFIFIIFFIFSSLSSFFSNNQKIIKCNQKYALCPAAKCIPDPFNNNNAYCDCFVKTGVNYSIGGNSCKDLSSYHGATGNEYIYSTFSPEIKNMGYHEISCPSQGTNLNCMNKICSVDPNNPGKAICVCSKIDNQGETWATFNKNNTNSSCNYLSGASNTGYNQMNEFIKSNP